MRRKSSNEVRLGKRRKGNFINEERGGKYKTEAEKKDGGNFMNLYVAGEKEDRIVQISDKMVWNTGTIVNMS